MRFRTVLVTLVFALPVSASAALDYSDRSLLYTDAPFSPAEAAGISLLTAVGAVEGNPDGTFQPRRTLNRAEFLKIVLASFPGLRVSPSDADACFPDIPATAWFSQYVCLAKKRGMVSGYPDGTFKPDNPVNYAEALKMLGELYSYTAYAEPDAPWYAVYVQAAINHKTLLPVNIAYDAALTRGQMARLAAGYLAEHEEELDLYRRAERGEVVIPEEPEPVASSSSSSVSSESSSSSSTAVSDGATEPPPTPLTFPAVSQLLLVGERSDTLASGLFTARDAEVQIRAAKIEFDREVKSIDKLYLVDVAGRELGTLELDIYDQEDRIWEGEFAESGSYILTSDREVQFGVVADLADFNQGGISEEIFFVREFRMIVREPTLNESYEIFPNIPQFPTHQTVLSRFIRVRNAGPDTGELATGVDTALGQFAFSIERKGTANPRLEELTFNLETPSTVTVTNWALTSPESTNRYSCSAVGEGQVHCPTIPVELGEITGESVEFALHGTVQATASGQTLQLSLQEPGAIAEPGAIHWSDGTGDFRWIQFAKPIAEGTEWYVQ